MSDIYENDYTIYSDKKLSELDDHDLVNAITQMLNQSRERRSRFYYEALSDFDFYAGNQWDPVDAEKLKGEGRPPIVFNRLIRVINAICGLEVQNRQVVTYQARNPNDQDGSLSDLINAAADEVRENCDAIHEDSEAFQESLICGTGWTETRVSYDRDPEGEILIDRIDPMEMYVDENSIKPNFTDATWIARIKPMPKRQIKEMWPDVEISGMNADAFDAFLNTYPHDQDASNRYQNYDNNNNYPKTTFYVVQFQWYENEPVWLVPNNDGTISHLTPEQYKAVKPEIELAGLTAVKQQQRKYFQAFVLSSKLLDRGECPVNDFSFSCITGLRDRNYNSWFSLVRVMKDPQRWANKWLSQILHILNTSAKSGLFAELGAFTNPAQAEQSYAETGTITYLNDQGLAKIKEKMTSGYPDGLDRLMQYAINAINDVVGLNLELLGTANKDQAVAIEESRKQAGVTILAVYFDSLKRYRKISGRVLLKFIQKYLTDGRLIKITDNVGTKYIPLMRQPTVKYDIVIDESPYSYNMKQKVFNSLIQIIPLMMQAGLPIPPDVLDYLPFPQQLIDDWKQLLSSQSSGPNAKLQQIEQQLQLQLQRLEVERKDLENREKQQKIATYEMDVEHKKSAVDLNVAKSAQAYAISQNEMANAEHNRALARIEQDRKNVETLSATIQDFLHLHLKAKQAADPNTKVDRIVK